MRAPKRPIHTAFLAVVSGMAALVLLRFIVHEHDNLFVAAEAVHSIGISVLIYKLMKEKTCVGKVSSFLGFDFCFGYAYHFWVDFAVPNPMEEDVEDFVVVEREEPVEEQRAAGEDDGGQREDGEDGGGQREDGKEY
ncbi:hypothetical protein ACFX13_040884 [Malus domestica]